MRRLRRRWALVFRGRYHDAGLEPPRLDVGDRIEVARRARARHDRPTGCDPLDLLVCDDVLVDDRAPAACGCEVCDGTWVRYRHHPDPRERGDRCWHGYAHTLLVREGWDSTEADAILLTGELALCTPLALLTPTTEHAVDLQPHATRELLELQMLHALTRLGPIALPG
jgi:hypothetical protein